MCPENKNAEGNLLQHQDEEFWKEVTDYLCSRIGKQQVQADQATENTYGHTLSAIFNLSKDDSWSQAAKCCESKETQEMLDLPQCRMLKS